MGSGQRPPIGTRVPVGTIRTYGILRVFDHIAQSCDIYPLNIRKDFHLGGRSSPRLRRGPSPPAELCTRPC